MKRSELSVIAVIVIISVLIAYFTGQAVLGSATQKGQSVQSMGKITSDVTEPDGSVFNSGAHNPTVPITIGGSSNVQPLSEGQ